MERRTVVLSLAALIPVACATMMRGHSDQLIYSHATHLKENLTCLDCHAGIDGTTELSRTFIPDHDVCERCHAKEMDSCTICHTEPDKAFRSGPRDTTLVFSHQGHMEAAKGNCARCHSEVPQAQRVEETNTPPMAKCGSCHSEVQEGLKCDKCHADLSVYPLEAIRSFAHVGGFQRGHADAARASAETCAQCHERTFCADCHINTRILPPSTTQMERSARAFIHPQPYIALHSIEAERNPTNCDSCHKPNFCSSCHASFGLATSSSLQEGPHPSGWLDPMSTKFHGFEARRRITSCAGCHDQGPASVCVRCHQVGGTGGNPHPPGFERRDQPTDNRMCRACHWR